MSIFCQKKKKSLEIVISTEFETEVFSLKLKSDHRRFLVVLAMCVSYAVYSSLGMSIGHFLTNHYHITFEAE